jgi:hypothetical protein
MGARKSPKKKMVKKTVSNNDANRTICGLDSWRFSQSLMRSIPST